MRRAEEDVIAAGRGALEVAAGDALPHLAESVVVNELLEVVPRRGVVIEVEQLQAARDATADVADAGTSRVAVPAGEFRIGREAALVLRPRSSIRGLAAILLGRNDADAGGMGRAGDVGERRHALNLRESASCAAMSSRMCASVPPCVRVARLAQSAE